MVDLKIIDRISECDDGKHRNRGSVLGVTVHMFGVPGIHDMCGIARFYRGRPQYTSGQNPYTYGVLPGGYIEQALPIDEVGPHALRWSATTIGVVALGNFNEHLPPPAQWEAAVDLVAELCQAFRLDPRRPEILAGHTERPNATRDPGKGCPGIFWPMETFRRDVDQATRSAAIQRLEQAKMFR